MCKKLSQVIKEEFFKADKTQNKEKMLRRPLFECRNQEKKLEKKRQNKNFSNEVMLRLETVCHFMSFIPFFLRLPPLQYFLWAKKGDFFSSMKQCHYRKIEAYKLSNLEKNMTHNMRIFQSGIFFDRKTIQFFFLFVILRMGSLRMRTYQIVEKKVSLAIFQISFC